MKTTLATLFALIATLGSAHMEMSDPPPYRSKYNKNAGSNIDYSMTSPLSSMSQYPCKGYQSDLGTPAGASVATWAAGSSQKFTIVGGAPHGGGSCQAALSYDKGATFKVIASYQGSCPLSSGQSFSFTVPSDATAGEAIFAWSWFNKIGNREIYMNCATVTIGGASKRQVGGGSVRGRATAFSSLPSLFVANLGGSCTVADGKEAIFPDPGPVLINKQTQDNSGSLEGSCASGGSGSSSGSGSGSGGSASAPPAPAPSASAPSASAPSAPAPSASAPSASAPSSSAVASPPAAGTAPLGSGGVFVPASTIAPTASVQPSATPSAPAAIDPPAAPSNSTAVPVPTGGASGTCTAGQFNCQGTSFQQCVDGEWAAVQEVAPGTKCTPGISSGIEITYG